MSTLLRVNGLTKRFESESPDVVSEVSFTVEPNEIFAILGVLDVPLRPTYPALTPLTGSHPGTENLAGISLNVQISVRNAETSAGLGQSNREGFLFTHKGFSGPAVLDVSHYATKYLTGLGPKPDYRVNWTSDDVNVWRTRMDASRSTVRNFIKDYLPNRLAEALASEHPSPDKKIAE